LPGVADGGLAQREKLENTHAEAIARAFAKLLRTVLPPGTRESTLTPQAAMDRYREAGGLLRDALVAMLREAGLAGAAVGRSQVEALLGVKGYTANEVRVVATDWEMVNQAVLDWVLGGQGAFGTGYGDVLAAALAQTSEGVMRAEIGEWIRNGLPLRDLIEALETTVFSRERAELIAVTEVTRAYAEGNRAAWEAGGIIEQREWQTANDELVCPICGPLQGVIVGLDEEFPGGLSGPPAHPRCRCWIAPVVGSDDAVDAVPTPGADETIARQIETLTDPQQVVSIGTWRRDISDMVLRKWPTRTTDTVVLTGERRAHYLARHLDVIEFEGDLLRTLFEPDEIHRDVRDDQIGIWYRRLPDGRYLRATVWISERDDLRNSVHSFRLANEKEVMQGRERGRRLWQKK
jgi:SPP1 gp7 family putative phage head morphogenesis protein